MSMPAGWHDDGSGRQRWWDGQRWTEHLAPAPPAAATPSAYQAPSAVFAGALGDNASGGWFPAQAEVSDGSITLWVALPTGWTQYFSVPANQVTVKSAAQRITLVVGGRSYPLLADARSVGRGIRLGIAGGVADVLDKPRFEMGVDLARGVNVAGGAHSFRLGGGPSSSLPRSRRGRRPRGWAMARSWGSAAAAACSWWSA